MEHQKSTIVESKHRRGQYAPLPKLPQQNSSAGIQPDFTRPPPAFIPNCQVLPPQPLHGLSDNCQVLPPQPLHGLSDPYSKFSPWGSQSDSRHNLSVPAQAVPQYDSCVGDYFHGASNVSESSRFSQNLPRDEYVNDKQWIQHFLMYQVRSNSKDVPGVNNCFQNRLKIFEAKFCVEQCQVLLQDLDNLEKDMMDKIESSNTEEWQDMCALVVTKKMHLEENIRKLSDPVTIGNLNKDLMKRRKKRVTMNKLLNRRKEEKMASLKRQQQLHLSIDSWLEEMQQSAERVKLEESLKQQADNVLSDVTRKKAEARRQLSLLSMLVKLRRIRVQAAANRGEKTSIELVHIFENVIEKLQKYWSDQLKDYNLEEKGLRVMLEEATEDNSNVKKSLHQRIMSQWQKVLFGRNGNVDPSLTVAERDIEEFIKIRHEWDKFVVPSGVPMASSIPVGWVLPVKSSSEEWENLLEAKN